MKSLNNRVVWSYVIVIFFVIIIIGGLFITAIRQYYYGSVKYALDERANTYTTVYEKYLSYRSLREKTKYMLDHMAVDPFTTVQILDPDGRLVLDSNGLSDGQYIRTPDVLSAVEGRREDWLGKDPDTLERIMAITIPMIEDERIVGFLRYSTSVEEVDQAVRRILYAALIIALSILLVSIGISLLLAARIIRPIVELTHVAKRMADGEMTIRAVKRHNDEIGHLADTLNYMAQELMRQEKLKLDFISSVSHELRTPLTSIKGWSETIVSGGMQEKEEVELGLNIISKETERLTSLVEDLLDFSKLYTRDMKLQLELIDINRLIEEAVQQFAISQERSGIRISTRLTSEGAFIRGDVNRLKQVFINLLDNAMKFTPEHGRIEWMTEKLESELTVRVSDNGEGIPSEDLPYVTEKFYKGAGHRSGSGLGLSICKEIVELHDGRLQIESTAGEGTVITIRFPLD